MPVAPPAPGRSQRLIASPAEAVFPAPRSAARRSAASADHARLRGERRPPALGEGRLKAPRLGYLRARSLEEVFAALDAYGEEARILAGGQSLVPALNMRLLEPRLLIDINGLPALSRIEEHDGTLHIGALARHSEIERSAIVARLAPLVRQAVPYIAHPAIRNRGTFGGSLAQADPAAEFPACAVALGATITLTSRGGQRAVAAGDFFRGLYETALAPGEIVASVEIPRLPTGTRTVFFELARRRGDYAMIGVAARGLVEERRIFDPRFVFFGAGERPIEAKGASAALIDGLPLERIVAAQEALAEDLDPPGDLQADRATRRHFARVLLVRAVTALLGDGAV